MYSAVTFTSQFYKTAQMVFLIQQGQGITRAEESKRKTKDKEMTTREKEKETTSDSTCKEFGEP